MIHHFPMMDGVLGKAKDAWNEIATSLRDAFQRGSQEKARANSTGIIRHSN